LHRRTRVANCSSMFPPGHAESEKCLVGFPFRFLYLTSGDWAFLVGMTMHIIVRITLFDIRGAEWGDRQSIVNWLSLR